MESTLTVLFWDFGAGSKFIVFIHVFFLKPEAQNLTAA